jgi:oligopeptide/dipeptide ABC transporter, ATP-binding protein, C-terminal domain
MTPSIRGCDQAMRPILEVRDLTIHAGSEAHPIPLVESVSFSVAKGSTLALVGESGCGKSMTALSLMRILPEPGVRIAGGEIHFEDEDLVSAPEQRMQELRGNIISMIFQDPIASLNPIQTVGNQIIEVIRTHNAVSRREAKARAIELLRSVRLPDAERRIDYYPHRLSGGMCQRVMIAMAMAGAPKVIIADEPTTALDTTVQAQVMALLRKAQTETGTAIVLITHNLAAAAEAAENVAVMYAGRIIEQGPVREIFLAPAHPYTQGLLGAIPDSDEDSMEISPLTEIAGNVPRPGTLPHGCAFAPRCKKAQERCRQDRPALTSHGNRLVACFFPDSPAIAQ